MRVCTKRDKSGVEKIAALETALAKTQQELEGSKKILLAHIDTINALEDRIKLRGENEQFDKDDEMVRIKMENLRLNAENAALLNSKQKMETHYTDEIQKLNSKYLKKADDYDSALSILSLLNPMLAKYNNLQETVTSKKLEELRAWKKRSENMRKTITSLEEKLSDLATRNSQITLFQEHQTEFRDEEHRKLAEEAKRVDGFWSAKKMV